MHKLIHPNSKFQFIEKQKKTVYFQKSTATVTKTRPPGWYPAQKKLKKLSDTQGVL